MDPAYGPGPPGTSQPLSLTVCSQAAAWRGNVTTFSNEDVLSPRIDSESCNVHSSGNEVPKAPRTSPFLDFDQGTDVNRSDFDDFYIDDLDDLDYDTASTLEASDSESDSGVEEDKVAMPPPKDIPIALPAREKTYRNLQPQPRIFNHTPSSLSCKPPQLGPTIPELLIRDDISPGFRMWAMGSYEAARLGDRPLPSAKFAHLFPEVFYPPFLHHDCPDTYFASPESFPTRYEFVYTSADHLWTQTLGVSSEEPRMLNKPGCCFLTHCPIKQPGYLSSNDDKKLSNHASDADSLFKVTTSHLPTSVHDKDRWYGEYIPTIIEFLGTRSESPWCLSVRDLPILQAIWVAVYGETLSWKIQVDDCVYVSVMASIQQWRDCISNAAVRAFEQFFQSSRKFDDSAARCRFCQAILLDSRLFYETFDTPFKRGLFCSPFVSATLAQHLYAIRGAVHVPSAYLRKSLKHPWGAIGLSAAAVYRAALLFSTTQIRHMNSATRMQPGGSSYSAWEDHFNFGELTYGAKAKQYACAASRLKVHEVNIIIVKAASVQSIYEHDFIHVPPPKAWKVAPRLPEFNIRVTYPDPDYAEKIYFHLHTKLPKTYFNNAPPIFTVQHPIVGLRHDEVSELAEAIHNEAQRKKGEEMVFQTEDRLLRKKEWMEVNVKPVVEVSGSLATEMTWRAVEEERARRRREEEEAARKKRYDAAYAEKLNEQMHEDVRRQQFERECF
ncbi:hypothetical protein GSI_04111 [Ganoderma sinense ZZ0214-1]|uniref:RWD domain-containing protein n=1 Tax=Ganoderma sinense ZZ0214-1 TaxID=1077348 RepID=A0A2G8SIV4_9APHY|nr:hypothetical protein GSI_04111 [Ganoderma sinense ZZ0214-1]